MRESDTSGPENGNDSRRVSVSISTLRDASIFPVIMGTTGDDPVFGRAKDLDLELLDGQLLDGRTQEQVYRPSRHGA